MSGPSPQRIAPPVRVGCFGLALLTALFLALFLFFTLVALPAMQAA
ncbi:MAG: hypothetical protein AB7E05_04430 [Sphingobium sp.]